jgi:hypothetical protein
MSQQTAMKCSFRAFSAPDTAKAMSVCLMQKRAVPFASDIYNSTFVICD